MAQIPLYSQYDSMDCGPTCLRMIASFYGKDFSLEYLRDMCSITNRGVTLLGLDYAAKQIGFETLCAKVSLLQSGCWEQGSQCGIVLCLEPTDKFFANDIRNSSYYGYKWIFKFKQ